MGITSKADPAKNSAEISVSGRFDFALHEQFRKSYEGSLKPGADVTIDLRNVDYMDSSALGMLLLLREYIGDEGRSIKIRNCIPEIRNILSVSNFEKLFDIG